MTCEPLVTTGVSTDIVAVLALAVLCLVAGAAIVLVAWHRRRRTTTGVGVALLAILVVGMAVAGAPSAPAHAATSHCLSADNSLTLTQTSTMEGVAPGVAPIPITGLVTNNGNDSTDIIAISVEIVSVTTSPDAPAGTCSAGDYEILDALMPVGHTLSPGGATAFTGASIVFTNRSTNQDACQRAVIHLLYTANPAS